MKAKICQFAKRSILQVRTQFKGYLLLRTNSRVKETDLVYLHLGVDGLIKEELADEVLLIQLKRLLERFTPLEKETLEQQGENVPTELTLRPENLSVLKQNEEIELTKKEYALLKLLMAHEGTALTYKELYQKVWQRARADERRATYYPLVANVIFHLREKLGNDSQGKQYIRTVRTKGYQFCQQ